MVDTAPLWTTSGIFLHMGVSIVMGLAQYRWFIVENPLWKWMIGGYPPPHEQQFSWLMLHEKVRHSHRVDGYPLVRVKHSHGKSAMRVDGFLVESGKFRIDQVRCDRNVPRLIIIFALEWEQCWWFFSAMRFFFVSIFLNRIHLQFSWVINSC